MGQSSSTYTIHGTVAPGYESVRAMFEDNFRRGREEKSQLCAYVEGERVVDLWGSVEQNDKEYSGDTLTNVFSSTKSLTALVVAMMVDRGLMTYDAKIADYWPEFAANGKEEVTVADLMRHEAGLADFDTSMKPEDTLVENIKNNKIGEIIEKQILRYPVCDKAEADGVPGKREYHAITRGWIANEIVRRVHPEGLTIGEILRKEVSGPLKADAYVGVEEEQLENYVPVREMKLSYVVAQSMIPDSAGSAAEYSLIKLIKIFKMLMGVMPKKPDIPEVIVGVESKGLSGVFNGGVIRRGESSSANGNCSARGLAVIGAALANGGTLGDAKLLSQKGWDALHAEPTVDFLFPNIMKIPYTQGGVCQFLDTDEKGEKIPRVGYYGWLGYGGSVFQWNPELQIGFAYTPSLLEAYSIDNEKGGRLQEEVAKCARVTRK